MKDKRIDEMMSEYVEGEKDVAKIQTQCICRILREARIAVDEWDVFADKIDYLFREWLVTVVTAVTI